jgi:hypothetical protein
MKLVKNSFCENLNLGFYFQLGNKNENVKTRREWRKIKTERQIRIKYVMREGQRGVEI